MKRIMKCLMMLLAVFLLAGTGAAASGNTPGNVSALKASATSETQTTLKWSKASRATGYYVYRVTDTAVKKIATVTKTTYTVKNLTPGTTYQFKVLAYRKVKGKIYKAADYSNTVSVTPTLAKPSKPKNVAISKNGSRVLTVSWDKVSNATGYQVFRYQDGTYTKVSTTKSCSVTLKNLKNGTKYTYVVRSYRKVGSTTLYSDYSAKVSETAAALSKEAKSIHGIYYNATVKQNVKVYDYTAKKKITLKKGTTVRTTTRSGKTYTAYTTSGHKIKISASYVRIYGLYLTSSTDYSQSAKEEYVNSKDLSSSTPYLICIDQTKARVNIFKGAKGSWKLVRTFKVIIGKYGTMSPRGIFKIVNKWANGSYGGPMLQWTKTNSEGASNAFHNRLDSTALGTAASHGCIRCNLSDLNWMYNNCAVGTTVYSY